MEKIKSKIYNTIFGDIDSYSLRRRIFIITSFYAVILCLFGAFVDYIANLDMVIVYLPLIVAFIFLYLFIKSRKIDATKNYSFNVWLFIIICVITLSTVWFYNDGYNSANSFLFFNTLMISIMISPKKHRKLIFSLFFFVILGLMVVHYFYPQFIVKYKSEEDRFVDILLSMAYNLMILYGLVVYVLNNYDIEQSRVEHERNKVAEYNQTLEQKNQFIENQNIELNMLNNELAIKNYQISYENERSEKLLLNILPEPIANRLKNGENLIADKIDSASIIFIDIQNFTSILKTDSAESIVKDLNYIYTKIDNIAEIFELEKIKTIGDAYMAAAGIPQQREDHSLRAILFSIEVLKTLKGYTTANGFEILFRIGIDCGEIIAGVIGEKKFIYDLWGEAVNTASRMESYGIPGKIHITQNFKNELERIIKNRSFDKSLKVPELKFEERGEIDVKGIGLIRTWFVNF